MPAAYTGVSAGGAPPVLQQGGWSAGGHHPQGPSAGSAPPQAFHIATPSGGGRFCIYCGRQVPIGSQFCPFCRQTLPVAPIVGSAAPRPAGNTGTPMPNPYSAQMPDAMFWDTQGGSGGPTPVECAEVAFKFYREKEKVWEASIAGLRFDQSAEEVMHKLLTDFQIGNLEASVPLDHPTQTKVSRLIPESSLSHSTEAMFEAFSKCAKDIYIDDPNIYNYPCDPYG